MRERKSEQASIREMEAVGLKYTAVPPRSYILQGPAGRFLWEGTLLSDECFSHADLGTINITRIIEQRPPDLQPQRIPIDANVLRLLAKEHDPVTLREMDSHRIEEPVIFTNNDSKTYLIDGSHRIFVRNQRNMKGVAAFFFDSGALMNFRVNTYKIENDGSKNPVDLTSYIFRN